jgi:hypothetical protein
MAVTLPRPLGRGGSGLEFGSEGAADTCSDDLHCGPAAGLLKLGALFHPCQHPVRVEAPSLLQQADQAFAVGVQETEILGASKAFVF